jgi:hypothetical protein
VALTLIERIAGAADATRAAQRAYFRDRTTDNLRTSKAMEAQLDKLLAEWQRELGGQHQESIWQDGPQG